LGEVVGAKGANQGKGGVIEGRAMVVYGVVPVGLAPEHVAENRSIDRLVGVHRHCLRHREPKAKSRADGQYG
jgi:hypothetical protein